MFAGMLPDTGEFSCTNLYGRFLFMQRYWSYVSNPNHELGCDGNSVRANMKWIRY
jgi:hypothetical protein